VDEDAELSTFTSRPRHFDYEVIAVTLKRARDIDSASILLNEYGRPCRGMELLMRANGLQTVFDLQKLTEVLVKLRV
jgi:hypothetical protein